MNAITLGPLFIPFDRLAVLAALVTLLAVRFGLDRRYGRIGELGLWVAVGAGLGLGRLVHVARYWAAYRDAPWEALYLWQGGYHVATGLVAALVAGTAWCLWRKQPLPTTTAPILAGAAVWWGLTLAMTLTTPTSEEHLPEVLVSELSGEPLSISSLSGQPTVINLWATWCGPCRREMPAFERAESQWPHIRFVYANQGEDAGAVSRYLETEGLTLASVVLDRTGGLMDALKTQGLPTTVFYDASGRLVARHSGEMSAGQLRRYLTELNP